MYYWTTNKHFKVETALLQFLSNLSHSFTGLKLKYLHQLSITPECGNITQTWVGWGTFVWDLEVLLFPFPLGNWKFCPVECNKSLNSFALRLIKQIDRFVIQACAVRSLIRRQITTTWTRDFILSI